MCYQGEERGMGMHYSRGVTQTCFVCEGSFTSFSRDVWGDFCTLCRADFGILSNTNAKEVRGCLEGHTIAERKAMRDEARKEDSVKRGTPTQALVHVDAEKVAAAARTQIQYGLLHGIDAPPRISTAYVIAKNGLLEVRHTDIADFVGIPKEVIGLTQELATGIRMNLPRIPFEMLNQTVAFFRETCRRAKGSSEAIVQIFWNTQEKAYQVHVPEQHVSGGSVKHTGHFDQEVARTPDTGEAIWLHVMDIHSHGSTMGAFWSSTDDHDEQQAPAGRMFGVIGQAMRPFPDWKWRIRTHAGFHVLSVTDIFDVAAEAQVPFTVGWSVLLEAATAADGVTKEGLIKLDCPVDPFKDATCPEEWHQQVKSAHAHTHTHMWGMRTGKCDTESYIYISTQDRTALKEYTHGPNGITETGKVIPLRR